MGRQVAYDIFACILLFALSTTIIFYMYDEGVIPGGSDWPTHLSNIKLIADNLPNLPRWDPRMGLGSPFMHTYPPLSHIMIAFTSWAFKINLFDACKFHLIFILFVGSFSTYILGREISIGRFGSFSSGVLFMASYSLYDWIGLGSVPNITAVMFTPLALYGFLRAVRKNTAQDIFLAGLLYTPVLLSHLMNTFILGVLLIFTGLFLIVINPELLYISRGPMEPPRYTMRLPKVLFISLLEALTISSWWYLPFLPDLMIYLETQARWGVIGVGPETGGLNLLRLFTPSIYYSGLGHTILSLASFSVPIIRIMRKQRIREIKTLPFIWFIICVVGGISPYLRIPIGLPIRFGPYLAQSMALLCGLFIEACKDFYEKSFRSRYGVFVALVLLLTCIVVQPIGEVSQFSMIKNATGGSLVDLLSAKMKKGERLATSTYNWINVFSDIWQTYGGMSNNEFSYKFWYFMFINKTAERLPFFAKNFNVKYFWGKPFDTPYLRQLNHGIYEIVNINSSLVESTEGKLLILYIGEEEYYTEYFFLAISQTESLDVLLVYGGKFLEDFDSAILRHFNIIYLSDLNYRNIQTFTSMLQDFLDSGGGIILESLEPGDIPPLFPVGKTSTIKATFNLTAASNNKIVSGINLASFSKSGLDAHIVYAQELRQGSDIILRDEDRPIIVGWNYSRGKVVWSGLNLPYLAMLQGNIEASKMLSQILRYVSSSPKNERAKFTFTLENERVTVNVKDATNETGIWVKISYDPRWTASMNGVGCKIIKAGPGTMLIFPMKSGDYTIELIYGKSLLEQIGETATVIGLLMIPASLLASKWKIPKGWTKTRHIGSSLSRQLGEQKL
ncbi:MAG: 6-pyruvoyl-tetrahydropterin synthase-related protein [Nitrososphaerota archaeon]|nr:6-pyruvoyl-tetrahydropterin synthase-related protein [Nitrososphaerota archaeon]